MPPKKAMIPAPIDRPLARAYLRQFTGWSTAYPPGLSDPTSFRIMENVMINKDTSARIRPGLRYLSYAMPPTDVAAGTPLGFVPVGSHEAFFLNDGSKAYLFAVRETDLTVGFRVLRPNTGGSVVQLLTDAGIDFVIPQGVAAINFTAATTYVKYLQVDNKIFALSDAGESMRLFTVGTTKSVRKILSIERPNWDVPDKLTVVQPAASWISGGVPTSTRTNLLLDPSFATLAWWNNSAYAAAEVSYAQFRTGTKSMKMVSKPTRTNLHSLPLSNPVLYGIGGWTVNAADGTLSSSAGYLRYDSDTGIAGRVHYVYSAKTDGIVAGKSYRIAFDIGYAQADIDVRRLVRYYASDGTQVGSDFLYTTSLHSGRYYSAALKAPASAVTMRLYIGGKINVSGSRYMSFKNVSIILDGESYAAMSGDDGANYFWTGAAGLSPSVYHPPVLVQNYEEKISIAPLAVITASFYARATVAGQAFRVRLFWKNVSGADISNSSGAYIAPTTGGWLQASLTATAPAGATTVTTYVEVTALPRGEGVFVDSGLVEKSATLGTDFDGDTVSTPTLGHAWTGAADNSTSTEKTYTASNSLPTPATPTANTLISTNVAPNLNAYNFGFFYVFSNEVGDCAASQVTVVKTQRAWAAWKWQTANANSEPSGNETPDPTLTADQLVAYMPQDVFDQAIVAGATSWSLYMMTWSDQDSVPVEALKVSERKLTATSMRVTDGWGRVTPQNNIFNDTATLPTEGNRYNYSNPSNAGQGLVAADRMILVKDPTNLALIRWSSNHQGHYTDFSANRGGGYKTLTSGNLYIPAAVKLWRNPQAVTTLAILCAGTDGHSTGYYMTPGDVTSQSDLTKVMTFEETTATPGTTSPYGCESMNNSLIHPLDDQLMKSTGSYYNISHKSLSELIYLDWQQLQDKNKIVSSQLNNRIYYIVNNPKGADLLPGCNGNEIWIIDSGGDAASPWSRFLIQAQSLRTIEFGGKVFMSVVTNDGIYYLDPLYDRDDYVNAAVIAQQFIPWRVETNTQGANRAHDVWAHLQQMLITMGFFQGSMNWGLRSWDVHGKPVNINKIYRDLNPPDTVNLLPFDIEDSLFIQKDVQQWYFYAGSIVENGVVSRSFGQINTLQYRYAPLSVNIGYERGSIETFEYGRATVNDADRNTDAGVPQPFTDVRRP